MFAKFKTLAASPEGAAALDAIGVLSLLVILVGGLHLPSLM
ncbi:hypothetical protein [Harenicola maris]